MTSVACGPYTIYDPEEVLDDGSVRLIAERTYTVKLDPGAPSDVLGGALRITPNLGGGQLRFGNFVGQAELGPVTLHVTSTRIEHDAHQRMLADVSRRLSALPFLATQPTGHAYARDDLTGPEVLYQSFLIVRHAMQGGPPHDLPAAVERILARPHELLADEREDVPLAFAGHIDGSTLHEIASRPERLAPIPPTHPLAASPGAMAMRGRLPTHVRTRRARPTTDTRENRFVASSLDTLIDVCRRVEASARIRKLASSSTVTSEAAGYVRRLERWRRHPVLEPLAADFAIPTQSTVLHGRPGYRHLVHFWLDLLGRTRLIAPDDAHKLMELRDAASTYEMWCYFAVVAQLEALVGEEAVLEPFGSDDVAAGLPWRHVARVGGVRVHYNLSFPPSQGMGRQPAKSYSVRLRPDICVEVPQGALFVFDAKLKRDVRSVIGHLASSSDGEDQDDDAPSEDVVTFARADLHKMHAYRDALGARSVWVLYPGDVSEADAFPAAEGADAVHAGVGAIPLTPGQSTGPLAGVIAALLETGDG